jgi:hypothetical protein
VADDWDQTSRRALTWVGFHDLRHFAAAMFASSDASTKEIMSRGRWKSVAIVVRDENASEGRDALLAQALNPHTLTHNVVPISTAAESIRVRSSRTTTIGGR